MFLVYSQTCWQWRLWRPTELDIHCAVLDKGEPLVDGFQVIKYFSFGYSLRKLGPRETRGGSVPVACVGKVITAHISAHSIRLTNGSQLLAEHTRSFQRSGISYQPLHYLDLLERKPGALRNGEPFLDWALPKPIKQLQSLLMKQIRGDKAMVKLLALMSEYDTDLALTAAELALEEGMVTPEAVLNIINRLKEPLPPKLSIDDIPLTLPPSANCQQYDSLLTKGSYAKG